VSGDQGAAQQEKFQGLVKRHQDKLVLPWLGTTMSIGVCSMVLTVATQGNPTTVPPGVRYLLLALGAALGTAAVLAPRRMITDAAVAGRMREQPDARSLSRSLQLNHEDYTTAGELSEAQRRLLGLLTLYRVPYLVSLALSEAVAFVGLAAGFVNDDVLSAAPYFIASFVLHGVNYPRLWPLIERGRKLDQPDEELKELSQTLDKIHDDFNAPKRRPSRTTGERGVDRNPSRPISNRPPPRKP
jgi:hypothetical protein